MTFPHRGWVYTLFLCLYSGTDLPGANGPAEEKQRLEHAKIKAAIEQSSPFIAATKDKTKVVFSTLIHFKDKAKDSRVESEFAESLHFDYDTGKTMRVLYNVTNNVIVKTEQLDAYPTPLAEEEIAQAKKLANEHDSSVKSLKSRHAEDKIEFSTMPIIMSDAKHEHYGKRMMVLILAIKDKPNETVSVLVNLTDGSVSRR